MQVNRNVEGAIDAFEAALKRKSKDPQIRYHYAMALLAKGDQAAALDELEYALRNDEYFLGRLEAERQISILKR